MDITENLDEHIPSLEDDMKSSPLVRSLLKNREVAEQFYAALCNMQWVYRKNITEKAIFDRLAGKDKTWSCTWRYAGGLIAEIRDNGESYLDFYCSGHEGTVNDLVKDTFNKMGWYEQPYN